MSKLPSNGRPAQDVFSCTGPRCLLLFFARQAHLAFSLVHSSGLHNSKATSSCPTAIFPHPHASTSRHPLVHRLLYPAAMYGPVPASPCTLDTYTCLHRPALNSNNCTADPTTLPPSLSVALLTQIIQSVAKQQQWLWATHSRSVHCRCLDPISKFAKWKTYSVYVFQPRP